MAWFARSIANTLKLDDDDEQSDDQNHIKQNIDAQEQLLPDSPGRGVKEDLSELTKTLTRQFWGVASFLAPPPPSDSDPHSDSFRSGDATDPEGSGPEAISSGIRSDFAEIGGRFRSGISKLSSNIAVSEITKMASNLLQLGPEDEDYDAARGAIGVTDEVVAFVRDIAMHPETWLDFPLPEDEDDEDFDLSDAQQEHALAVERLAPRLAALRFELCPGYMSEDSFWKIYFVLLHPRLDRHDAEILSTLDIVKSRALLTHELQDRAKAKPEQGDSTHSKDLSRSPSEESLSVQCTIPTESVSLDKGTLPSGKYTSSTDLETEKYPVSSTEIQIVDKSVIEEGPKKLDDQISHFASTSRIAEEKDVDDADDWLKEENSEMVESRRNSVPVENDEDVSFSDLEEDDGDVPISYKKVTYGSDSSTKDSRDWVQLGRSSADSTKDIDCVSIEHGGSGQVSVHNSETKESNDWLDVDGIDVA